MLKTVFIDVWCVGVMGTPPAVSRTYGLILAFDVHVMLLVTADLG